VDDHRPHVRAAARRSPGGGGRRIIRLEADRRAPGELVFRDGLVRGTVDCVRFSGPARIQGESLTRADGKQLSLRERSDG
jgi:hypothetical protein